jgi:hypothetical protein
MTALYTETKNYETADDALRDSTRRANTAIRATLDSDVIRFIDGEGDYERAIRQIAKGTYNVVYEVKRSNPPLVLRVSIEPRNESVWRAFSRIVDYEAELQNMRRMADLGLGPRVYAELRFGDTGIGVVMERLELSLLEAESCPFLARRVFVDHEAESELVDLYARASREFTCVDTVPPNVLFDNGRIVMIDMSPRSCLDHQRAQSHPKKTTIGDLWGHLRGEKREPHLDATCVSLLIHCVFSAIANATSTRAYGFPYARVARCLCDNWDAVWDLVRASNATEISAEVSLARYSLLDGAVADKLGTKKALESAVRAPMTRLMLATRGVDLNARKAGTRVPADLYQRAATLKILDRERFESGLSDSLHAGRLKEFVEKCESRYLRHTMCRGKPCTHKRERKRQLSPGNDAPSLD